MRSNSDVMVTKKKLRKTKIVCNRLSNKRNNQNGYPCSFCCRPKAYNSKSDIQKHYKSCHFGPAMLRKNLKLGFIYISNVSFVCVNCGKRLKSKNAVLLHIDKYHSDSDENATSDNDAHAQIVEVVKNNKKEAGFFSLLRAYEAIRKEKGYFTPLWSLSFWPCRHPQKS